MTSKCNMVTYHNSNIPADLEGIIALQKANLSANISKQEAKNQGFVTVVHDTKLLEKMGERFPHTIAKCGEQVVAYALSMTQDFRDEIPVLVPMFEKIDSLKWGNIFLRDSRYVVMGQVCVSKAYRGKGIFKGLYHQMRQTMQPSFEAVVTEIAKRNTRSFRAHEKVGFQLLHEYPSASEIWQIVAWDWK